MMGHLLQSPLTRVILYYILLVLGVLGLIQLFPALESAFLLGRIGALAGLSEFAEQVPEAALADPSSGFLERPGLALRTVVAALGALALAMPVAWVYIVTKRDVRYDQSVVHTVIMLPIAVAGIVIIVQDSLPLAFSLAGIVAAVRFRNTLQDTKDAVYIFLAIGIGLAAGVQALLVAVVMSVAFNIVVVALWRLNVGELYAAEPTIKKKKKKAAEPLPAVAAVPDRKRGSMMIDSAELLAVPTAKVKGTAEPVLNPELSVLEFDSRVLALAEEPDIPVLARVRFLSIFSSNLDEFFMVKVGGLKQAMAEGVTKRSIDGQTPRELLQTIAVKLRALVRRQYRCFQQLCDNALGPHGIRIRRWAELDREEQEYLREFFDERVFPMLTPKAITQAPGHPFPYIEDLLLSLAVVIRDPRTARDHFVHLKIVDALPRFVQLPDSHDFLPLEEVIGANIGALYPGRQVLEVHPFRITRSGEIQFDEKAANFLEALEDGARRRPSGAVIRIEVERSMPYAIRDLLLSELRREESGHGIPLEASDIYETEGMVDLGALGEIADLPLPEFDYPPFTAANPIDPEQSVFAVLDEGDVLVHHPYDSFETTVQRFLVEAAADPDVVAIKLTLYRPGGPSAITDALLHAAAAGKEVSVFVEVKARFDEELNIYWAKQLERGGIHVVTGLVKHKTHAKLALVVRRRGDTLYRYAHIGTGNYNAQTACQYTDFGLLTSEEAICNDLSTLFNELTGSSRPPAAEFTRFLVAPTNMLQRFIELIEREKKYAEAGHEAHIRVKINGLADTELIEALYHASQAGVRIDLSVRAICALRPGVPGLSDNIRVTSILGRFLEHGRIFYFANAGDPEYYIGSADWRPRNLRRRVEVVTPVLDPVACSKLDRILEAELNDPAAWELEADGTYVQGEGAGTSGTQEQLLEQLAVRS
ncbi:MAG: polyphosphate kinase 1 [Gemmatimonadales bacterium]|nr:polyphosphate kinase 1 [Gemmatimonadales bacterium]NIN12991.1 polyphosphate kinase 1 [Gemmatimonadales bacterium]NIN51068.1 polyphosphate kinase 1 [Gemmatimonadales bacterium]NIP08532.1 polyphosphate kinase 1 [Gemmatimonadales bacterium]NIR02250.1 polyphosphate kinase 1 [Gemmatimonadales bacterium]